MSAGLPGLGLGGIFFILSALLAPVFELPRTIRGQSSRARWRRIAGHVALALGMIVAIEVALEILVTALGIGTSNPSHVTTAAGGAGGAASATTGAASGGIELAPLPVPPVAITAALLAALLGAAKLAEIVVRIRPRVQGAVARIRPRAIDPAEERA
jgi:hypothetical protein